MNIVDSIILYLMENPDKAFKELGLMVEITDFIVKQKEKNLTTTVKDILENFADHSLFNYLKSLSEQMEFPTLK